MLLRVLGIAALITALIIGLFFTSFTRDRSSSPRFADTGPTRSSQTGYVIDNGIVYWRPITTGQRVGLAILTLGQGLRADWARERILHDADLDSFRTLTDEHARDHARAWFRGVVIDGADMSTFAPLDHGFSHDATHVWFQIEPVLVRPEGLGAPVQAFSEAVFSVGDEGFAHFETLLPLPEAPQGRVVHGCRDWFVMNDAVWQGSLRRLSVGSTVEILACDGSIRTSRMDGQLVERVEDNSGLLLRDGLALQRILRDGQVQQLGQLTAEPVETRHYDSRDIGTELLFTRDASGEVQVFDLQGRAQSLGRLGALPARDVRETGGYLIGDQYFTVSQQPDGPILIARGSARRIGEFILADNTLFHGDTLLARTEGQELREVGARMLLVGPACLNGGYYMTDVLDPQAPQSEIAAQCSHPRDRTRIVYDGWRIGVDVDLRHLGSTEERDMFRFALGSVFITNVSGAPRTLGHDFLSGFDLRVARQSVALDLPGQDTILAPEDTLRLPVEVVTEGHERLAWDLSIAQTPERVAIFPEPRLRVSAGTADR